jgi:hypothetical protein
MDGGVDFEDPGWMGPLRGGAVLVPFVGRVLTRRSDDDPESPLVLIRKVFGTFAAALFWLLWVAVALGSTDRESALSIVWSNAVSTFVGGISFGFLLLIRQRPLACGSDKELAGAYANRFFSQVAVSQVSALAGIVATFLSVSVVPYLIGGGIAAAGLAVAAPTRSDIRRTQELLKTHGCPRPLGQILTGEGRAQP